MKEFCAYFFGKGEEVEFTNFSAAHIIPILLLVAVIFLIYRGRETLRVSKADHYIRHILSFMLIVTEMAYFWRLVGVPSLGANPVDHLPITVCGWAVVFCSLLVLGKAQSLYDIAYFWLFSGTVFALITPTVITYTGPTRFRYYQFWLEHTLGYIAIFYMTFVHGMRPTIKSALKAYVALVVLAVIAFLANKILGPGANYLFMAEPEDASSLQNILPSNMVAKVAMLFGVIIVMFFLAYLPWLIKDKKAKAGQEEKETVTV